MSSIKKLKKQIYAFQNLGSDASIEKYKWLLRQILTGYKCLTRIVDCEYSFRARINTTHLAFTKTCELHYPPPEYITSMGRMNRINTPIFYIASSHETATLEVRPSPGDVITIMRYRLKEPNTRPRVMELGVAETNSQYNLGQDVPIIENTNSVKIFNKEDIERNLLIRGFIANELMKIIPKGNEHLYKRSIAIYELLSISDNIDGLEYSSIAGDGTRKGGGVNLGIKPEAADLLFEPEYAWMSKVIKIHETFGYEMQCINTSDSIENGVIHWKQNQLYESE